MVEVERKYRISNKSVIENSLNELGYKKAVTIHQSDKVYLQKSDSFRTFKVGDPVTRIREVNGSSTLTFKRAINSQGDTIEHEMTVEPASEAEDFLLEIGYKSVTDVDKIRTEFKLNNVTVSLDEVTSLGNFVEVEILCNEGEEELAQENIARIAKEIGLNAEDIEKKKYDQLISELPGSD